jgi:hypothetical protein
MRYGIIALALFVLSGIRPAFSQEILCSVEIDTRQVEGTEKKVFETLRNAVYEFINNRKWTGYEFELNEKIECSILLTIEERIGSDEFRASLNLTLRRPVLNSTYNSPLFNYIDRNFNFKYVEFQPLDFDQNTYLTNLTSVLAYYVYIFIGLDFDTFVLEGGTPYFEIAQNIVNSAQNSNAEGWKSFENQRNRFWLVENLMNPSYKPIRKFFYEYHRRGLDVMYDDPDKGRQAIGKSLKYLEEVKKSRPGLFLLQIILDAKRDEIINVFSEGSASEKNNAAEIMKKIDPSHTTDYQRITN